MNAPPVRQVGAALRQGAVPPPAAPTVAAGDPSSGRDLHHPADLTTRSSIRELTSAVPGLQEELADRARRAGLLVALVAVVAVSAWTSVDRIAVPHLADTFLVVRLLSDVPMLMIMWALWRLPIGRRKPELLAFLVLVVVQVLIAWMIVQTRGNQYYLLGFTLAVYASGGVMVARPRWTVAVVAVTWIALAGFAAVDPGRLPEGDLVTVGVFLGSASVIGILAHLARYALDQRELVSRVRLEHEQQRTGLLLDQLERLSHEDPLTGLANRRRWDTELGHSCAEARREETGVAVVLVDIDDFKRINDRYGHPGGDEALRQVAGLLSRRVRAGDLVARLGGDELAVLMPGADLDRACELAERLRVEAGGLQPEGFESGAISLSLGVAAAIGDPATPLELMSRADQQLYRAKITRNAVGAPRSETSALLP